MKALNILDLIPQDKIIIDPANPIAGYIVLWKPAKVGLGDPNSPKFLTKKTQTSLDKSLEHAVRLYNSHNGEFEAKVIKDDKIYIRSFKISKKQSSTELDIKNEALAYYEASEDKIKPFSGNFADFSYLAGKYDERRNYVLSNEVSGDLQNYIEKVLCGIQLETNKATYFVANCYASQLEGIETELRQIGGRLRIYEYLFSTDRSKTNLHESIMEDIQTNLAYLKSGLKQLKDKRETDGYPGGVITDLVVNYKKLKIYQELLGDINQDVLNNLNEFQAMLKDMFSIPKHKKEESYISETINRKVEKMEEKRNLYK